MADEQDHKHNYLPFLSGYSLCGKQKRRMVPTAFVEFCDIGIPESTTEIPREYHNQFKPSSLCLPKIQPRCVRERETLLSDIPKHSTLPLTSNKVPFTFTEGLSALSASKPPLFSFQRSDVPSANLPNGIKLSDEKIKGQYTVERRMTINDTPRRTTLSTKHIALKRRDTKLEPAVPEMKRPEYRPFLKFAPNVIYDKRPQKNPIDSRSYTPYNKNTKYLVVPKEIGMTELERVSLLRQKSVGSFYKQEINRLREKKSNNKLSTTCVLGVSSVSKTKLELPFSVLREKHASKPMTNQSCINLNKSPDFSQYQGDSEACSSVRFVIKMPHTTDMHHNEISEVAHLNTNNSNNRESSFEIDECHSMSVGGDLEVDETRLLSIEPIDLGETFDSNAKLSLSDLGDNTQSEDLPKQSDTVPNDTATELIIKGKNSAETCDEKSLSSCVDKELDHHYRECIKQIDTEPNLDDNSTELDVLNSSDGAKKKLRLEVRVLKRTLGYREITTQMYYS